MSEFVPKKKKRTPLWVKTIFIFSILLLLGGGFSFWWFNKSIDQQKNEINQIQAEMNEVMGDEEQDLKDELKQYKVQIDNYSQLLNNHKQVSPLIDYLETVVHPDVIFNNITVNVEQKTISLNAYARNYKAAGQQILGLYNQEKITQVDFSDLQQKENQIVFKLNLTVVPEIFNYSYN